MPSDREIADLCWAILQQVDTRRVNWDTVAKQADIGKAQAARMRWTRFNNTQREVRGLKSTTKRRKQAPPEQETLWKGGGSKGRGHKKPRVSSDEDDSGPQIDLPRSKKEGIAPASYRGAISELIDLTAAKADCKRIKKADGLKGSQKLEDLEKIDWASIPEAKHSFPDPESDDAHVERRVSLQNDIKNDSDWEMLA